VGYKAVGLHEPACGCRIVEVVGFGQEMVEVFLGEDSARLWLAKEAKEVGAVLFE